MRFSGVLNVALIIIIAIMAWFLFTQVETVPAPSPSTGYTPAPTSTPSLAERVSIASPKSGATVGKSFEVTGMAPGNWYFEASFPVEVQDESGNQLVMTHAEAESDWMTTELVPYKAAITITGSYKGAAKLILHRDNPSGLPEHDESVVMPITIQ